MTAKTKPKTKIAVLIGSLDVGGAERDIVRNFPRLNRDEFEVVVVLFSHPGPLVSELDAQGVRWVARTSGVPGGPAPERTLGWFGRMVKAVPEGIKRRPRQAVKAFFRWRPVARTLSAVGSTIYIARVTRWVGRQLAAEQVDIVHAILPHSYAYGMVARTLWRRKAKTVMSRLSLNFYADDQPMLAWLERHVLHRRLDIAIGNSKLILDELVDEGVVPEKVRLLYNGIELDPFERRTGDRERARGVLALDHHAFVIVAVGNLWAYKGHADLIQACALACSGFPESWSLLIAGRDEDGNMERYERMAKEVGIGGHVRLVGPSDNVPQLLRAADVFAQPSHHEGLPNAIIEAMAASLPVIGTSVGGIPEVVTAGGKDETGWLVPPGDVDALSAALLAASEDDGRRGAMGKRARARAVAEFSVDRSVREYEAIYRELLP